tara:strand:- start:1429 stop:1869 length:441 start_codon:yes stop_codon:yes gene_type:complete
MNPDAIFRPIDKIFNMAEDQETRLASPLILFQLYSDKPIFGWGLNGALEAYISSNQNISLTSTNAYLMAGLGLSGVLYILIPVIGIIRISSLTLFVRLLLTVSYFFIVNKEPHVYFTLTNCLLFFMLHSAIKKTRFRTRHKSLDSE